MGLFSRAGNIFRQPRALQASNAMLQGNLSLTPSKIFVGGLSPSTDVELLKEAFGSFGKIVDAVVVLDRESGLSRGFGFVTYDSIEVANNAMQAMQNKVMPIFRLILVANYHESNYFLTLLSFHILKIFLLCDISLFLVH
jgi:RNA recognition motif-containing protein